MSSFYLLSGNNELNRYYVKYNQGKIMEYLNNRSIELGARKIDNLTKSELDDRISSDMDYRIYENLDSSFTVFYDECEDIKNIILNIKEKEDYMPDIDSQIRMDNYYKNCILLGENATNYLFSKSIDSRISLKGFSQYYDTEYEIDILELLSMMKFEYVENISLKDKKNNIERNALYAYDSFKNSSLKYDVKDYQDIIISQVDRLFTEYKEESIENSKVLSLAYMKTRKS